MISMYEEYRRERLRLLKRAKLKQLENQLQDKNLDNRDVMQVMKDIRKIRSELKNI